MIWKAEQLEDLPQIVQELIPRIEHNVVQFRGDMGAGKTTLIKEIIKQLGSQDEVSSPTYALVNEYETEAGTVYHFDFYRINDESEAYDMGWEEYADSENLCLVEWPEKIESLIPEKNHILQIENQNNVRIITFQ
ncbi:tRNA (adenosine(37)-N6)-threonylcarbamoyltransferase complex ATPase subunit type 1 TsaE [Flavobacteriaceae bacterium Ap0902]|nr:tRNA (adenosine(37)-N6)-threonylcarbamoyltransferase complex ATPase subunit type 1 TsaE [Flavobacteriaceae bacterium Ap0902]